MLNLTRTRDGLVYLHVWREGDEYFRQKSGHVLKEWTNVKFVAVPAPPIDHVHYVDVSTRGLDVPDGTFDAANVYHALEHLTPREGQAFVQELFRVLKPGAICRLSTPDLESICRDYLQQLDVARTDPTVQHIQRYQWHVMEIFEQMVRETSGGLMLEALRSGAYDRDYLEERYSDVYRPFLEIAARQPPEVTGSVHRTMLERLTTLTPRTLYEALAWRIAMRLRWYRSRGRSAPRHPRDTKERVGWMYDRLSLRLLMERSGFVQVQQKSFKDSDIPHWSRYDLDCSNHADRAIDPSVYVEGRKP